MRVKTSKQPPPAPTTSAVSPCPTAIQIVGRPGTGSLPSTIAPPDHPRLALNKRNTGQGSVFYVWSFSCNDSISLAVRKRFLRLRPDFTSKLVHVLAFGTPKFFIAPYDKIKHELVNLSSNCDVKSGLNVINLSTKIERPTYLLTLTSAQRITILIFL